jgi:hypothetical protein
MKIYAHLWYSAEFFLEWEIFQTKVTEKIKTLILFSVTFSLKSWRLWGNVKKYDRDRSATENNAMLPRKYAICMRDT